MRREGEDWGIVLKVIGLMPDNTLSCLPVSGGWRGITSSLPSHSLRYLLAYPWSSRRWNHMKGLEECHEVRFMVSWMMAA